MYKWIVMIVSILLFVGCGESLKAKEEGYDKAFDNYKTAFMDRYWKMHPDQASSAGYHVYDSVLKIPDESLRASELDFTAKELATLQEFKLTDLSAGNQIDYRLIENSLKAAAWEIQEFKSYEWDPSNYNVCGSFAEMLNNDYAPLDKRLRDFSTRLLAVPSFYAAAVRNIKIPTSEHTQLAIDQNTGGISVFTADLPAALAKSQLPAAEKDSLQSRTLRASVAITSYVDWLKKLKNDHPRDFRLGKELYAKKFAFDIQSAYKPEEIYQKAINHKKELHQEMIAIAGQIWTKHMGKAPKPADPLQMVRRLIDKLSLNHSTPESFQSDIERQIPALEKFVNDKKLLYLDPKMPLVVRREPDYMAGVAGASISSPGPYDKNGNTYYNVGSLSGWKPEASESYLREYNDYILQILNIHEAVPGHYTQQVYSNQSPSIIKSIFGNGAMVEGWAVYTERMMLENGYGNNEPEMWLMYYKWNLRTTCNTILDYSIHNLHFSKEQAFQLLVNEAFQQEAEAEGKWKRATLTQVQLCSYFTGYSEIYDLREELKKKQGNSFGLKNFHEQFLSYGSAPVMYIRELMLKKLKGA